MYINPDVAHAKVKDIDMLFNFDIGVVAGIDQQGLAFYKKEGILWNYYFLSIN
ncbi:hypothetical protein ACFQ5M_06220 [Agrilactobacillus yilanensis]|uniref:Uncharacterized protein n=1 Tax=Agrilactobacillus yilanensis TaxID=2485997 RepID=A0ABW4J616_9LACO|nr:hypothetical protein [Agrilactobacillus yilanensis]